MQKKTPDVTTYAQGNVGLKKHHPLCLYLRMDQMMKLLEIKSQLSSIGLCISLSFLSEFFVFTSYLGWELFISPFYLSIYTYMSLIYAYFRTFWIKVDKIPPVIWTKFNLFLCDSIFIENVTDSYQHGFQFGNRWNLKMTWFKVF